MRNEIALRNDRIYEEDFSIQEIAERIVKEPDYLNNLQKGVPQFINKIGFNYFDVRKSIDQKDVRKGQKLGVLSSYGDDRHENDKDVDATDHGLFILNKELFKYADKLNFNGFEKSKIQFGKIILPERGFFIENQKQIEEAVERLKTRLRQEEENEKIRLQQEELLKKKSNRKGRNWKKAYKRG